MIRQEVRHLEACFRLQLIGYDSLAGSIGISGRGGGPPTVTTTCRSLQTCSIGTSPPRRRTGSGSPTSPTARPARVGSICICLICAPLFAEAARMPPRQFNTLRWCDLPQCLNPTNATSAFAANNGHHGLGLMTSTAWYLIQPSPSNASGTWRSACL